MKNIKTLKNDYNQGFSLLYIQYRHSSVLGRKNEFLHFSLYFGTIIVGCDEKINKRLL